MNKETKKKAAASAVAAVTAAGVLVGGAFADPDDILDDGSDAIVQTMDMGLQADDDGGSGGDPGEDESDGRRGIYASVRRLVKRAPRSVRAVVVVPLWAIGTVIIALASSLWSAVLSPVASTVLGWVGIALLALIIFAMAVKTVCPDMPLKKILNKSSVLTILLSCFVFGVLDAVLPFFWDEYEKISQLLKACGSLLCTGVPVLFFLRRHKRRGEREDECGAELSIEEKELATRNLLDELADSVCPKYR